MSGQARILVPPALLIVREQRRKIPADWIEEAGPRIFATVGAETVDEDGRIELGADDTNATSLAQPREGIVLASFPRLYSHVLGTSSPG